MPNLLCPHDVVQWECFMQSLYFGFLVMLRDSLPVAAHVLSVMLLHGRMHALYLRAPCNMRRTA